VPDGVADPGGGVLADDRTTAAADVLERLSV
jgi:hypothetical protein